MKLSYWLSYWMVEQYPYISQCPRAVNDAAGRLIVRMLFTDWGRR